MAVPRLPKIILNNVLSFTKLPVRFKSQRRTLGKPPGIARSLAQRLEESEFQDPEIYYKVNIGYAQKKASRKETIEKNVEYLHKNRSNLELEMSARKNKLIIPLDKVEEEWASTSGPQHIKAAAEHYGIYDHLFGDAYFLPVVNMDINYLDAENLHPVYRGNYITPSMTTSAPNISFKSDPDALWTIVMTTPDGHLENGEKEYVHWLIGNIQGSDIAKGDVVYDYMQPFPMRGLGYLRYIFVLFKQEKEVDFRNLKKNSSRADLSNRTFSTYDFYKNYEGEMTPSGLAWFQADWDSSVATFFHKRGFQEEPCFVYDFPKPYQRKQEWFPIKQPFNLYLDRYRDEKDIGKEYLLRKLKNLSPFSPPPKPLPFPNAVPFKKCTPSWLKTEIKKRRLYQGRAHDYK